MHTLICVHTGTYSHTHRLHTKRYLLKKLDIHWHSQNSVALVCAYLLCTENDVISCDSDRLRKKNKSDGEWRKIKKRGREGSVEASKGGCCGAGWGLGGGRKTAAVSLILEWLFSSVIVVMQIRWREADKSSLKSTCSLSFRKVKVGEVFSVSRCPFEMLSCIYWTERVSTEVQGEQPPTPQSKPRQMKLTTSKTKLKSMALGLNEDKRSVFIGASNSLQNICLSSDSQTAGNTCHTCSFPALLTMLFEVHFLYLISQNGGKSGFLYCHFKQHSLCIWNWA